LKLWPAPKNWILGKDHWKGFFQRLVAFPVTQLAASKHWVVKRKRADDIFYDSKSAL